MSLGYGSNQIGTVNQGDTAELYAALRVDEVPVPANQIANVYFTVQRPDNTQSVATLGGVMSDGQGFLRWTDTTQVGEYIYQARFTLTTGEIRSVVQKFAVLNPFEIVPITPTEMITDQVWLRIEDCFDTLEGGPWLRDITLASFNEAKIANFIPEAILDINVNMPVTSAVLADFTTPNNDGSPNNNMPVLIQGVLCLTLKHLMRSYVEQPVPTGAQLLWDDRTRYVQTWQSVYQIEHAEYIERLRLWKRQCLNLGHSALITVSKAGRLLYGPGMRMRNIGRGIY